VYGIRAARPDDIGNRNDSGERSAGRDIHWGLALSSKAAGLRFYFADRYAVFSHRRGIPDQHFYAVYAASDPPAGEGLKIGYR
jgi:hypothetical protein